MSSFNLLHAAVAFAAAFAAGAINSVAGGGTLISFPTLIWLGLNSVTANATNTVAIWPGSLGGMWGFRRELRTANSRLLALLLPSLIGGLAGAWLLRYPPPALFDRLVPFLILFATLLFMAQETVQRLLKTAGTAQHGSWKWLPRPARFLLLFALFPRLLRRRHRHPHAGRAEHPRPYRHPPDERPEEPLRPVHQRRRGHLLHLLRHGLLARRTAHGPRRYRRRHRRLRPGPQTGPHRRSPHRHLDRLRHGHLAVLPALVSCLADSLTIAGHSPWRRHSCRRPVGVDARLASTLVSTPGRRCQSLTETLH